MLSSWKVGLNSIKILPEEYVAIVYRWHTFCFISRLKESYVAVQLKDQDLANSQQQVAKNFIRRYLYGAGSNRTTGNVVLPDCS